MSYPDLATRKSVSGALTAPRGSRCERTRGSGEPGAAERARPSSIGGRVVSRLRSALLSLGETLAHRPSAPRRPAGRATRGFPRSFLIPRLFGEAAAQVRFLASALRSQNYLRTRGPRKKPMACRARPQPGDVHHPAAPDHFTIEQGSARSTRRASVPTAASGEGALRRVGRSPPLPRGNGDSQTRQSSPHDQRWRQPSTT